VSEITENSTCGYCSTGCNLTVRLNEGKVVRVTPNPEYPVNLGKACPKGFQFLGHLSAPDRALTPRLRDRAGRLRPVSWEAALRSFCDNFRGLQARHGNESVAFISTGQLTNEEFAFLGTLAKFGMGFVHGDGNTRQCMATAVVAHKQSFGFDAPPFTYKDFEESDVLVFIGSNPAIAHPIMWHRVKRNQRHPRIIVLDPRATETAVTAGVEHYGLRPKSDLILLYGLARILISRGWIDQDFVAKHTTGFDELRTQVDRFDMTKVGLETGLSPQQIEELARTIHDGERVSFWWMVGINQGYDAVRTAQAIINLALLTGNIGRPGTGANSITGQCNAMGTRLFGNAASLLCGRDFANPVHRREVAGLLGIDEQRIPQTPGFTYERIIEGVEAGGIKGLWIICTNPAHSWIDRNHFKRVLAKAEFVVVQDMFADTETAKFAHLMLPAAGCGEKDGTFINSERRFGVVRKILEPPGEALPDFEIFRRIAQAWGRADMFRAWSSPEAVFGLLRQASRGRPCDFTGIDDYAMLDRHGGIQWPFPDNAGGGQPPHSGAVAPEVSERRLFEDGVFFHPDGRARLIVGDPEEPPERPSEAYPFTLLTGRGSISQWHTLTRTDRAPLLKRASPDPAYVEINPADASGLGIEADQWVQIVSPRGRATVKAKPSDRVQPGQLFIPMHFNESNNLTVSSFDPYSRQPSFKYAAVAVRPAADTTSLTA
jgi:assimilatory nitrate reductase catalytic subunit